jgi:DNA-binding response OmpR family regulator
MCNLVVLTLEQWLKILVVDDDPNITELLSVILGNEGFRNVHCSLSSADGLAALKNPHSSFECLMLDMFLNAIVSLEVFCEEFSVPYSQGRH